MNSTALVMFVDRDALVVCYFVRGSCCEVMWWVCLSVCLSARISIPGTTLAIFTIFVHAACVRGSVLLRHVDDRPHRVSLGRGSLPHWQWIYLRNHTRNLYRIFIACCLYPWLGPFPTCLQ